MSSVKLLCKSFSPERLPNLHPSSLRNSKDEELKAPKLLLLLLLLLLLWFIFILLLLLLRIHAIHWHVIITSTISSSVYSWRQQLSYSLRPQRHNFSLPITDDDRNKTAVLWRLLTFINIYNFYSITLIAISFLHSCSIAFCSVMMIVMMISDDDLHGSDIKKHIGLLPGNQVLVVQGVIAS